MSLLFHYKAYLLLLFLNKWNDFANKNEAFYNLNIKKINDMFH